MFLSSTDAQRLAAQAMQQQGVLLPLQISCRPSALKDHAPSAASTRPSTITMSHLSTSGGKYHDDNEYCELEVSTFRNCGGDTMFGRTILPSTETTKTLKPRQDSTAALLKKQHRASTATTGATSSQHHNFYGADASSPTFKTGAALFHNGDPLKQRWGDIHMIRSLNSTTNIPHPTTKQAPSLSVEGGGCRVVAPSSIIPQDPDIEDPIKKKNELEKKAANVSSSSTPQKTLKPSAGIRHIKRRKGQSISLDFGADNGESYGDDDGVTFDVHQSKGIFSNRAGLSTPTQKLREKQNSIATPTTSQVLKSPPPTPQLLLSLRQVPIDQQQRRHQLSRIQTPISTSALSPLSSKRGLLARKWIHNSSSANGDGSVSENVVDHQRRIASRGEVSHSSSSSKRELVPFLSTGALVESAMSGVGGTGSIAGSTRRFLDPFLHDARIYLKSELKLVDASDGNSVLGVYREVFESLESQFGKDGCGPLLRDIRYAYETRIGELEKIAQIALTGDPSLQKEKERYLSCQEEALTAIERSLAHERTLRSRIVEAEQHGHQVEISVATELTDLRDKKVELSERAILDNAAIRDLQETLHNYSVVNQELRDRLDRADYDTMQKQQINNHKVQEICNELTSEKHKHMETILGFEVLERHRMDEMNKLREECIDPKEFESLKLHAKKLEESVRTLKRKLQWAEVEKGRLSGSSYGAEGGGSTQTDNLNGIGSQPDFGGSTGL